VEDRNGNVLVQFSSEPDRALSRTTAEDLTGMMRGVVNAGTGEAIRTRFGIRADVAGKTGTTQNNTDGWFIMMHPQLVVGTWVGFDDARVTMRSNYWGQGAHNALPIAGDFFRHALDRRMVDGSVQFPRARDALPGSSLWNPIVDWFNGLRGKRDPYSPPPQTKPAQTGEPPPEHKNNSPGGVIDGARRRMHEIEKSVEDIKKLLG
jgi:penicillin-binding protein 1A